jgi:hypothetical protein
LKLWLLDADVIIKLLEIDVFDRLANQHDVSVTSTVIAEVKYFRRGGRKIDVDFRCQYVETGLITETFATADEMKEVISLLPVPRRQGIHAGEIESLAVLVRQVDLTLCTFDAAAIRTLPFLGATERVVSAERLLQISGLTLSPEYKLDPRLSQEYLKSNLDQGNMAFVLNLI